MTAAQPGSAGDRTFRGRDPQTVAGQAISAVTPTKCQARTRLIIAVPTFITGFYGMNVPYPGFSHQSGLAVSVAVMIVAAVALYVIFRRRDWL